MPARFPCLPAAVALFLCASALAAEVDEARERVKAGHPESAFELLEPLERTRAGDLDFDYMLGVAALDARHYDRAVIAFERVLAAQPKFASARFDLARAYFALGADDLAAQEFHRLLEAAPTAEGERAIRAFLDAIDKRRATGERRIKAYVEAGGGHDNNLSSTTPDFTSAIAGAFGIPGVLPTGNSILYSSAYASLGAGVSATMPLRDAFDLVGSLDVRHREHKRHGEFDWTLGDGLLGIAWHEGAQALQVAALGQAFRQDGAAPPTLSGERTTSDRNGVGANIEWRRSVAAGLDAFAIGQWMRLTYTDNETQDTDQAYASAGLVKTLRGRWSGVALASVFYSKDRAKSPLNAATPDVDVSRHNAGVRAYAQADLPRQALGWLLVSWSRRTDDSPFARATTIGIGRDTLWEVTAGLTLPHGRWSLRPTVSYVKNRSNIALYAFEKTDGAVTLRYEFP